MPSRFALVILLHLVFPLAILAGGKSVLTVWTSIVGPDGKSRCGPCNKFWADLASDASFQATLTNSFEIRPIYAENHPVEAKLRLIEALPTFVTPHGRITGYTSSDDLLERLRLKRLTPPRQPQAPATTQPRPEATGVYLTPEQLDQALGVLNSRFLDLQKQVEEQGSNLNKVGVWIESDHSSRREQLGQIDQKLDQSVDNINLRLQGFSGQIDRILKMQSGSQADRPAEAPEPESRKPGIFERILEIGRYPATWFLGPLGGAGVTGVLWYLRTRKKKSRPSGPHPAPLPEPLEGNTGLMERILDRLNRVENLVRKPPVVVPVDSPPIRETVTKQEYVPYETDQFRDAVAFAHREFVRKYPGAVGSVEFIDALVDQYLKKPNAKEQLNVSK